MIQYDFNSSSITISGSPVWISSPISTGGRPLVSVLAVPEARARLVGEIEGLMDELNLPCKDRIRTTMFVGEQ